MQTLNVTQTSEFITHIAMRHQQPVFLWGQPGVGKSAVMAQLARECGAVLVDLRLSQYDSVDLRGFPGIADDGTTVWHVPSTLPFVGNPRFAHVPETTPIILFLDEANSATTAVAAVAYQLVNDRRVGEHTLMRNVVLVAAGNREGDKGVTNRMPTPLANRFTHVEVGVDTDQWCFEYAQGAGLPAVGIAFLQFRKNLLSTFDPSKPDKAFATPRTWEKALRYFADTTMPLAVRDAAMAGAIGDGPAAEFLGFVDVWHKVPDIKQIMQAPKTYPVPDAQDMALTYATAVAISGHMSANTTAALALYLDRLSPEFTVLAWKLAIQRDTSLFSLPEFVTFSKKFKTIFTG
jgi:hypothetical protein